jgi:hypothetical protein
MEVPPRQRRRVGKREMMKRLAAENFDLRSVIADLHQQIAAVDAENAIISESLSFFQQIGNITCVNQSTTTTQFVAPGPPITQGRGS